MSSVPCPNVASCFYRTALRSGSPFSTLKFLKTLHSWMVTRIANLPIPFPHLPLAKKACSISSLWLQTGEFVSLTDCDFLKRIRTQVWPQINAAASEECVPACAACTVWPSFSSAKAVSVSDCWHPELTFNLATYLPALITRDTVEMRERSKGSSQVWGESLISGFSDSLLRSKVWSEPCVPGGPFLHPL